MAKRSRVAKAATRPLQADDTCHGFRISRVTPLPNLRATAVEARHERTGARLLHLHAEDTENLFAVAFRTPPPDDTGVPHILEHSVLGGSARFPVKDPFLEMVKRSMATFINAMTYSDKTVYPVASNVRRDYFNLVDVYLDAVFHPMISALTLKQEGHRLELTNPADPASPLIIKGIVYNEMKGAYSELDSLIECVSTRRLFPESPYGRDSGGDPAAIPTLTYEAFRGFYERLYHPSNAFILLYGNIATCDQLAFLDERLALLPAATVIDSALHRQVRWTAPREHVEPYPIDSGDNPKGKAAVTVTWLVGDAANLYLDLALDIVDKLLLGHAGAPLYKALIDSRLGEDLTPSGYSGGTLETTFHAGLKGTDSDKKDAIVLLIDKVLRECSEAGFTRESVDAAFQQLQYAHREISSMFPLRLMNRVYDAWIYDLDPLTGLRTGEYLDELYRRYEQDPQLFARLLRERLVDNPHRLTVTFVPDPALQTRRDAEFATAMAQKKTALAPAEIERIATEAAELEKRQNTPNSPAALDTLPVLHLPDLPAAPRTIPGELLTVAGDVRFLRNDVFANGVNYLVLAIDLDGLPVELWEPLPLFTEILAHVGAGKLDYVQMGQRIAGSTGGLGVELFTAVDALDPARVRAFLTLSFKALDRTFPDALAIVRDLLLELDLKDTERLRDLVFQAKAQRQSGIVDAGHRFAAQHAGRHLSGLGHLNFLLGGLPQVRLAGRLAREFDREIENLRQAFGRIRQFLLNRRRLHASFTGSAGLASVATRWLEELAAATSAVELGTTGRGIPFTALPASGPEGLALASEVAFCALCLPAPPATAPEAPAVSVFSQLLSLGYLWEEIRAKGGAYGGFCAYDGSGQLFQMLSYRDPNIPRTLSIMQAVGGQLAKMDLSPAEIERAVISCAKIEERPIRPGPATATALWRQILRYSDEVRRERYQALLGVDAAAVRTAAAALLDQGTAAGAVCVLAGRPLLEAANAKLSAALTIEDVLEGADEGDAEATVAE